MKQRERGQGRLFLRGEIWWLAYWHRGKEHRESSGSRDMTEAEKRLKRVLKEIGADQIGARRFDPRQEKIRISELLDALEADYKRGAGRALPQLLAHMKHVREEFGDDRALALNSVRLDRYIERRLQEGKRAPATVNRELETLRHAFTLARKTGTLTQAVPYIPRLKEENTRTGFFEKGEFEGVVNHLPEYLKDFTRFAYLSGWRKGEVISLTWADVDRNGRIIHLRRQHSKNGRARKLALEGNLGDLIEDDGRRVNMKHPTDLPWPRVSSIIRGHRLVISGRRGLALAWMRGCPSRRTTRKTQPVMSSGTRSDRRKGNP